MTTPWSDQQQAIFSWFEGTMGHLVVRARAGCLSGDTTVEINRAGKSFPISLSTLVRKQNTMGPQANRSRWGHSCWDATIPTRIRATDPHGYIQLYDLTAAVESGTQETYSVHLADGRVLCGTASHPFLTPNGWYQLRHLRAGIAVLVEGPTAAVDLARKPRYRVVTIDGVREPEHRLVVEADLNGLTLDAYIRERRAGLRPLVRLGERQIVHHRNGDTFDNQRANLVVMDDASAHARHHGHESAWRHVTPSVSPVKVREIREYAAVPTYDLTVDDAENFLANGMVVHNTGKTTTILEAITHAPEQHILLCAYNKRIQEDLQARLTNPRAVAQTLHSVGYACIRRYWERMRCDFKKSSRYFVSREDALTERVCGGAAPDPIKRLVSKLHTKGREILPLAQSPDDLADLADEFECVPDPDWERTQFGTDYVLARAFDAMLAAADTKPDFIDGADMVFLPIRNQWLIPTYDMVVVDEAQDMSRAQLLIAKGVADLARAARIVVVGDDRQSLYGFRGAASDALDNLKAELHADELGLNTTYRCPRLVVERASRIVPDYEAHATAQDGEVRWLPNVQAMAAETAPGDFVLSRKNAPLAQVAMAHIRANKRVRVAGKDLGAGLVSLAGKIAEGRGGSMVRFLEKLMNWETREIERAEANKKDDRIEAIRDKAATLRFLAEDVTGVPELLTRLESLFTDVAGDFSGSSYVTCSSVHKAKGLEAERVYVLVETLYPSMPCASCGHFHKPLRPLSQTPRFSQFEVRYAGDHTCWRCGCPEQRQPEGRMREEANIEYVALTRAKKTLVLVGGQCPVDLEPPAPVVKAEAEVTS